jgi:hypothetical protein
LIHRPAPTAADDAFASAGEPGVVVVPIVLGRGERLWDGLEALEEHFRIEAVNSPSGVTHLTVSRRWPQQAPAPAGPERLLLLVGIGEGDLEGPLVGAAHDPQLEGAAPRRREGVEQVVGGADWPSRGRHDQVA